MVLVLTQYLKGSPRKYVFNKACTTDFAKSITSTTDSATKLRAFKRCVHKRTCSMCYLKQTLTGIFSYRMFLGVKLKQTPTV